MGGISGNIERLIEEAMQHACEFWHEMTGGELFWIEAPVVRLPDMFERMEIASRSGATFRG